LCQLIYVRNGVVTQPAECTHRESILYELFIPSRARHIVRQMSAQDDDSVCARCISSGWWFLSLADCRCSVYLRDAGPLRSRPFIYAWMACGPYGLASLLLVFRPNIGLMKSQFISAADLPQSCQTAPALSLYRTLCMCSFCIDVPMRWRQENLTDASERASDRHWFNELGRMGVWFSCIRDFCEGGWRNFDSRFPDNYFHHYVRIEWLMHLLLLILKYPSIVRLCWLI
jgi:hypothetical protein